MHALPEHPFSFHLTLNSSGYKGEHIDVLHPSFCTEYDSITGLSWIPSYDGPDSWYLRIGSNCLISEFKHEYDSTYKSLIKEWVGTKLVTALQEKPNAAGFVRFVCIDGEITFDYNIGAFDDRHDAKLLDAWDMVSTALSESIDGFARITLIQDDSGSWHIHVLPSQNSAPSPEPPVHISESARDILGQIFSHHQGWDEDRHEAWLSPNLHEISAFAELLATEPKEQALQEYLEMYPKFLMATCGFADSEVMAVLRKPPIGQQYYADFAVLSYGQGGFSISLFEIEDSHSKLFTKIRTPSKRYRSAITQVNDWSRHIQTHFKAVIDDHLRLATAAPRLQDRGTIGSFRLRSSEDIHKIASTFGADVAECFCYTIIIGRWAKLTREEREMLIHLNRRQGSLYETNTYDQVLRDGFVRPYTSH